MIEGVNGSVDVFEREPPQVHIGVARTERQDLARRDCSELREQIPELDDDQFVLEWIEAGGVEIFESDEHLTQFGHNNVDPAGAQRHHADIAHVRLWTMDVFNDRRDLNGVAVLRVDLCAQVYRQRSADAYVEGPLVHLGVRNAGKDRIRYLPLDEAGQKARCIAGGSSSWIIARVGRKHGGLTCREAAIDGFVDGGGDLPRNGEFRPAAPHRRGELLGRVHRGW